MKSRRAQGQWVSGQIPLCCQTCLLTEYYYCGARVGELDFPGQEPASIARTGARGHSGCTGDSSCGKRARTRMGKPCTRCGGPSPRLQERTASDKARRTLASGGVPRRSAWTATADKICAAERYPPALRPAPNACTTSTVSGRTDSLHHCKMLLPVASLDFTVDHDDCA